MNQRNISACPPWVKVRCCTAFLSIIIPFSLWATFETLFQVFTFLCTPISLTLSQVPHDLSLNLLPWRSQYSTFLVVFFASLECDRSKTTVSFLFHPYKSTAVCISILPCLKLYQSCILILSNLCIHLLRCIKTWIHFMQVWDAFQVSHPYSRTELVFEMKLLSFVRCDIFLTLQAVFKDEKTACTLPMQYLTSAFPSCDLISAPVPPSFSKMIPRKQKNSVFQCLIFNFNMFPLRCINSLDLDLAEWILSQMILKDGAKRKSLLAYVPVYVTEKPRHLQKTGPPIVSTESIASHFFLFNSCPHQPFNHQNENRNGDSNYLYVTPVLMSKLAVSCPSFTSLQHFPYYMLSVRLTNFWRIPQCLINFHSVIWSMLSNAFHNLEGWQSVGNSLLCTIPL